MAENYKIRAVKPEPKQWPSAYGPMLTYTVMFAGRETPVEINKKPESPAPQVGDEVFGNINRTEYGDKFKSEQKPFSGAPAGGRSFGKPQGDQFTMYLSYAKDLAIACAEKGVLNKDLYSDMLSAVEAGGAQLYAGRPDAPSTPGVQPDVVVTTTASDNELLKNIDDVFGDDEPWAEPTK